MKILSLFDGMACGMLAMQKSGIPVDRYVAFEIDKYAVQTSSHNFPMIEHKGDVFAADFTEFKGFDFLVGGSPCTYWSIAQTKHRETVASGMGWELFSQYVRALKEAQPMYFIYENNKSMSAAIRASITETFGFEPICINSALVSAQNRQRLYWVGKRNADGTYSKVHVEQPEDRGIQLQDVLDTGFSWKDKQNTIDALYYKGGNASGFKRQSGKRLCVAEPVCVAERGRYTPNGIEQRYEARQDEKPNALTTVQKDNNVCEPVRVDTDLAPFVINKLSKAVDKYGSIPLAYNPYNNAEIKEKAPTLTAQCNQQTASSTVFVVLHAIPCTWDDTGRPTKAISGSDNKEYPVYEVKDGLITIKGKQYPIKLQDGFYIIRKLTVNECKRLQTVPEWYEFPVSDTQAYKMLGNGWTVDVIAHLIEGCVSSE